MPLGGTAVGGYLALPISVSPILILLCQRRLLGVAVTWPPGASRSTLALRTKECRWGTAVLIDCGNASLLAAASRIHTTFGSRDGTTPTQHSSGGRALGSNAWPAAAGHASASPLNTAYEHAQLAALVRQLDMLDRLASTASACRSQDTSRAIKLRLRAAARGNRACSQRHPRNYSDRRNAPQSARPHNADPAITRQRRRTRHDERSGRRLSGQQRLRPLRSFASSWSATCSSCCCCGAYGHCRTAYVAGPKTASPAPVPRRRGAHFVGWYVVRAERFFLLS